VQFVALPAQAGMSATPKRTTISIDKTQLTSGKAHYRTRDRRRISASCVWQM